MPKSLPSDTMLQSNQRVYQSLPYSPWTKPISVLSQSCCCFFTLYSYRVSIVDVYVIVFYRAFLNVVFVCHISCINKYLTSIDRLESCFNHSSNRQQTFQREILFFLFFFGLSRGSIFLAMMMLAVVVVLYIFGIFFITTVLYHCACGCIEGNLLPPMQAVPQYRKDIVGMHCLASYDLDCFWIGDSCTLAESRVLYYSE